MRISDWSSDVCSSDLKEGEITLKTLPRWQRAIVVAAGPMINLLLAAFIFAVIAYAYGYPAGRPLVTNVIAGSPAATAGLVPGDEITSFNGSRIIMAANVRQHLMIQRSDERRVGQDCFSTCRTRWSPY